LDVTANLVGVLIVLIVLLGLRVRKLPESSPVDSQVERRLAALRSGVDQLRAERIGLEQDLYELRQGLTAKQAALAGLRSTQAELATQEQAIDHDRRTEEELLRLRELELADAEERLVSLTSESAAAKATAATRKLVHRSPLSKSVEMQELHFELLGDHVSFIDLAGLMDRVRTKCRAMEAELRAGGGATSEVGPVGPFRLRFTMAREDLRFSESLFYAGSSFNARLMEWQLIPSQDPRGEPVDEALQGDSQFHRVLARNPSNMYATTLWTYSDSFSSFRRIRDHLTDRGYVVAARPLPLGIAIRGSPTGSRSIAQ
jgi:hypothetical protein